MNTYWQLVQSIPLPSVEQTERFCAHLEQANPWGTLLPAVPPGAPFVFFLDPHAGMAPVGPREGMPTGFRERVEGEGRKTRGSLSTVAYRSLYGHWTYRFGRTELPEEVEVLTPDGRWCPVAPELVERSLVRLTAFLQPGAHGALEATGPRATEELDHFLEEAGRHARTAEGRRYLAVIERARPLCERLGIAPVRDVRAFAEQERARLRGAVRAALSAARSVLEAHGGAVPDSRVGARDLFALIMVEPRSDDLRLMYADALEAAGRPEAALARTMCQVAMLEEDEPERPALEARLAKELVHATELEHGIGALSRVSWTLRCGFVDAVAADADTLDGALLAHLANHPISGLQLRKLDSPAAARLAGASWLGRIASLELAAPRDEPVLMLLASPHLKRLRRLVVSLSAESAGKLRAFGFYRNLETLELTVTDSVEGAARAALEIEPPEILRALRLKAHKRATARSARHSAWVAALGQLEELELDELDDPALARELCRLPNLRSLTIGGLSEDAADALFRSPLPPRLLSLRAPARPAHVRELLSREGPALRRLALTPLGDAADAALPDEILERLAASPLTRNLVSLGFVPTAAQDCTRLGTLPLRRLVLGGAALRARAAQSLAAWNGAHRLVTLELVGGGELEAAAAALFDADTLVGLRRLFLRGSEGCAHAFLSSLGRPGPTLGLTHLSVPSIGANALAMLAYAIRVPDLAIVDGRLVDSRISPAIRRRFTLTGKELGWTGTELTRGHRPSHSSDSAR